MWKTGPEIVKIVAFHSSSTQRLAIARTSFFCIALKVFEVWRNWLVDQNKQRLDLCLLFVYAKVEVWLQQLSPQVIEEAEKDRWRKRVLGKEERERERKAGRRDAKVCIYASLVCTHCYCRAIASFPFRLNSWLHKKARQTWAGWQLYVQESTHTDLEPFITSDFMTETNGRACVLEISTELQKKKRKKKLK